MTKLLFNEYERFLIELELEDSSEVASLHRSISNVIEDGDFNTVSSVKFPNDAYSVSSKIHSVALALDSDKQRLFFLKFIEEKYGKNLDLESLHSEQQALAKND